MPEDIKEEQLSPALEAALAQLPEPPEPLDLPPETGLRDVADDVMGVVDKVRVATGMKYIGKRQQATQQFIRAVGDVLSDAKDSVVGKKEDTPEEVSNAPDPEGPGAGEVNHPSTSLASPPQGPEGLEQPGQPGQ